MDSVQRQPLILVVEDDDEFREEIIPEALTRLSVRVLKARNVLDACLVTADHDDHSGDPLDLIVLDMRMPLHDQTDEVAEDGGIQFLRSNRLTMCPVVVFTVYPSFGNCVKAMQAGATAYLPKEACRTDDGSEGGIDQLIEVCRRLLTNAAPDETHCVPDEAWLSQNYEWLCHEFADRWVAFVASAKASSAGMTGTERVGLTIISEEARADLVRLIAKKLPLLGEVPQIVFVPGGGALQEEPQ